MQIECSNVLVASYTILYLTILFVDEMEALLAPYLYRWFLTNNLHHYLGSSHLTIHFIEALHPFNILSMKLINMLSSHLSKSMHQVARTMKTIHQFVFKSQSLFMCQS